MNDQPQVGLSRLVVTAFQARVLALLVVVLALVPLSWAGRLGQGLAVAPAGFAVVLIASVLVAELVSRRDARGPGVAAFETRRLTDYLSRGLLWTAVVSLVALIVAAGWTTAVASRGPEGAGRSFAYVCADASCDSGAFGPFPGSFYTVPIFVAVALVLIAAGLTLRTAVRRPRNGADPLVLEIDEQVRRASVRSVVAAVLLAVGGSLAGIGFYSSLGLLRHWSDLDGGARVASVFLLGCFIGGSVVFCWSIVLLVAPLIDRPRLLGPATVSSGRARARTER